MNALKNAIQQAEAKNTVPQTRGSKDDDKKGGDKKDKTNPGPNRFGGVCMADGTGYQCDIDTTCPGHLSFTTDENGCFLCETPNYGTFSATAYYQGIFLETKSFTIPNSETTIGDLNFLYYS